MCFASSKEIRISVESALNPRLVLSLRASRKPGLFEEITPKMLQVVISDPSLLLPLKQDYELVEGK